MTKLSRRAVFGAGTAVLAASLPVLATAAEAEPDPVFALIEAAKRAEQEEKEADDARDRIATSIGDAAGLFTIEIILCGKKRDVHSRWELEQWIETNRPDWLDNFIMVEFERHMITTPMPVKLTCPPEKIAAYRSESEAALAKFDEADRVRDTIRETSGLNAANEKCEERNKIFRDAADAVLKAEPRTSAGARALLLFSAEYVAEIGDLVDEDETLRILMAAARAIPGPELAISEQLEAVLSGRREAGYIRDRVEA